MLKVEHHELSHAKFPVVDVHAHFRHKFHGSTDELEAWVKIMDRNNIAVCVSLDGQWGDLLDEHARLLWNKYRDRFVIFANIDWQGDGKANDPASWDCQRPDFARRVARELAAAKEHGASGVKIFKQFGLEYKNAGWLADQDRRSAMGRNLAGVRRAGLPILIHVADPAAFFLPIDETNERWEELHRHPEWSFFGPQFPKREELFAAFLRCRPAASQDDVYLSAHVRSNAEDLATVGQWLDDMPESLCRNRQSHCRAGPSAVHRAAISAEVPGPRSVWHRRSLARGARAGCIGGSWKPTTSTFPTPSGRFRRKGFGTSTVLTCQMNPPQGLSRECCSPHSGLAQRVRRYQPGQPGLPRP